MVVVHARVLRVTLVVSGQLCCSERAFIASPLTQHSAIESSLVFTLGDMLGLLATVTTAIVSPLQLLALLRAPVSQRTVLAGTVSMGTVVLLIVCNTCWFVYGIQHDAVWTSVLAVVTLLVQAAIMVICVHTGRVRAHVAVAAVVTACAVAVLAWHAPAGVLGATGAAMSMANYLPALSQRLREAVVVGHAAPVTAEPAAADAPQSVYSLPVGVTMMVGNALWIAYAAAIHGLWVGLPCVLNPPHS